MPDQMKCPECDRQIPSDQDNCGRWRCGPQRRSREAFRSRDPGTMERIQQLLEQLGEEGATDDEIEAQLRLLHQTASSQRRALVKKGITVNSGRTRLTRSGRKATVWVLGKEENA